MYTNNVSIKALNTPYHWHGIFETPIEHFYRLINKNGSIPQHIPTLGCCWEYLGDKSKKGYGRISIHSHLYHAHRVSWIIHNGEIPPDIQVCHKCDNRSCVNPDHLFLGTNKDNWEDAKNKGRLHYNPVRGSRNNFSKLTEQDVLEIRSLSALGYTRKNLSEMFGMSYAQIRHIVLRERWAWLE